MTTNTPATAAISIAEIIAKAPDPVAAIRDLGVMISKSQMMGPTDRLEMGQVCVMICATENLTVGELFRTYQISFGRLEKRIDAAMAEFKRKGGSVQWTADGSDGKQARATFTLDGESITAACTVDEAAKAGWTRNTKWSTEPTTMLRARVKKRGILALCPGIFYGEYEEENSAGIALEQSTAPAAAVQAMAPRAVTPPPVPPVNRPEQRAEVGNSGAGVAASPVVSPPTTPAAPATVSQPPTLSDEIQTQLVAVIGADRVAHAELWARSVGWLADGFGIDQMSEKNARLILAKPDNFRKKLSEFIAAKGGAK